MSFDLITLAAETVQKEGLLALQADMAKASSQLEQLHISLSRTVTIRFADQQPLLAELREALQRTRRHAAALVRSEPALSSAAATTIASALC